MHNNAFWLFDRYQRDQTGCGVRAKHVICLGVHRHDTPSPNDRTEAFSLFHFNPCATVDGDGLHALSTTRSHTQDCHLLDSLGLDLVVKGPLRLGLFISIYSHAAKTRNTHPDHNDTFIIHHDSICPLF